MFDIEYNHSGLWFGWGKFCIVLLVVQTNKFERWEDKGNDPFQYNCIWSMTALKEGSHLKKPMKHISEENFDSSIDLDSRSLRIKRKNCIKQKKCRLTC